jgi:hypothetical protein
MFLQTRQETAKRGNLFMFFTKSDRFRKYINAILIGLPCWYVIGILINQSDRFAKLMYGSTALDSGRSIMLAYVAISIADVLAGFICQWLKSRKKALFLYYCMACVSGVLFFSSLNSNDGTMYFFCALLGFSTGFWAIFVTMAAEQFGTNLRATAATTVPNMVRGALPLMNLLFLNLFQKTWGMSLITSGIITGVIVLCIGLLAFNFTDETYNKDLNYVEL